MSSEVRSGWSFLTKPFRGAPLGWRLRLAVIFLLIATVTTVYVTNRLLTDRFTESTRNRAEVRLALYSGNLLSELRRNAIVPQLLARDPTLISALRCSEYSLSTQRLISFVEESHCKEMFCCFELWWRMPCLHHFFDHLINSQA